MLGVRLLGEPLVELSPYEVEAWHFDGVGIDLPAGVMRIERAAIESSGAGNVPEILERLAGIRMRGVTGNGTEGEVAMRGFGDNSGLRALVLVDGQIYNPPDMGGINWLGIDLADLETVEVIRGGQTVLYGNHAVAGVIKLKTRKPGKQLGGNVRMEAGSDGFGRIGAGFGQDFGTVAVKGGFNRIESDGYRQRSAMESLAGHLSMHGQLGEATEWSSRLQISDGNIQFPGPVTYEVMIEDPRKSLQEGNDNSENRELQWTWGIEGTTGESDWQLHGAFLDRDRNWELQGVDASNELKRFTLYPRLKLNHEGGFVITGVDGIIDELDFIDYARSERDIHRAKAFIERLSVGAYAFISHDITDKLTLSGGYRRELMQSDNTYTRFTESQLLPVIETNRGDFPNPEYRDPPEVDDELSYSGPVDKNGWAAELSVVRAFGNGLRLWSGLDRVYRYPALDETASYQGYPLSDPLNRSLKPETGYNFELGIKWQQANWDFSATYFDLSLSDEISFDGQQRLNTNIGDTRRKGIEWLLSYRRNSCGIDMNASLVDATFDDSSLRKHVPLVPEVEAGLNIWYLPVQELRLQANLRWLDEQFQGNDFNGEFRKLPSSALLHLTAHWKATDAMGISLNINNALDEVYAATAYSGGFYPGPGRRVVMRIDYTF